MDIIFTIFLLALVALALIAAAWVVKSYMNGQSPGSAIFGQKAERRLAVMEQASVDGRRRLILIRRDGVEHLIMTGGPVDVVIETGIGDVRDSRRRLESAAEPSAAPVFARPARPFGQAGTTERAAE